VSIKIKSREQLEAMREGGKISAGAIKKVLMAAKGGVSLADLEKVAEEFILDSGGEPAFKRVRGYDFATCLNLNEGVVHGLPSERKLREGDIFSVDLGTFYKGLNTDTAVTVLVGDTRTQGYKEKVVFLETGERALEASIDQCRVGNRIGDISVAMEEVLRGAGYSPVENLVGHGVGEELHEDPQIPCFASRDKGPELKEGMALAIEVIYTAGDPALEVLSDGWTIAAADRSLAGLFEHSVAVTADGPIVLTNRN
jgi:methionyl aminopeptidase